MLLIFVSDVFAVSNKAIIHLTFPTIMFCDEICIRIAILILTNDCVVACDSVSAIAIKCLILFNMIDNLCGIDVVLNSVTNTAVRIEFVGTVSITFWVVAILYFIGIGDSMVGRGNDKSILSNDGV